PGRPTVGEVGFHSVGNSPTTGTNLHPLALEPQSTTLSISIATFGPSSPRSFNAPNDRTEEIVNLKPTEGPLNTILVTSRMVDLRSFDPAITLKFQRFRLDPQRGYAVVRHDLLLDDPAVKQPTDRDHQRLMDQWEQTPNGIWYPTRVGTGS